MQTKIDGNKFIVSMEGRIDSANASLVQAELMGTLAEHPELEPVIDADKLEYISSAGLRILMQASKGRPNKLKVRNVPPEIYEIFDMTGFVTILDVQKKMREMSVEGCEIIGKGGVGTLYRIDRDTVVKVYIDNYSYDMIETEQKKAKQAFLKGIPTAISYDIVKVGDKYGAVFEMLRAQNLNDILREHPEKKDEILDYYAGVIHQVHSVTMDRGFLPDCREVFCGYVEQLKEYVPEEMYLKLKKLFSEMPEDLHAIHGDLHMKNIMVVEDEPLLIDMETLSVGNPIFDLMGIFVTYQVFGEDNPGEARSFLGLEPETTEYIWEKMMDKYFAEKNPEEKEAAIRKIKIVAYVRFLYLITIIGSGGPALKDIRMKHAIEHLEELLPQADTLLI